jgi:hypothetical protein
MNTSHLVERVVSLIAKQQKNIDATGSKELKLKLKEKDRKEIKNKHPHSSLKFDVQTKKWMRCKTKNEAFDEETLLSEVSLRTGSITVLLMKVKQYASKVDKGVTQLKSLSSQLRTAGDDKKRDKIQSDIVNTDAEVFSSLRKMVMYASLVSGAGGLGGDRTYKLLKKMEKQKRR